MPALLPYKPGYRERMQAKFVLSAYPVQTVGFTLIELSIVLVIVGLLVGGVLVGADLIEAAKLRAVASDYEKYNTAVNTFKLKYNCLAGDCKNATTFGFASNGDGDKTIDYPHASYSNTPQEPYYFWQHLGAAGLIGGTYSGTAAETCASQPCNVPGTNVPSSPMGVQKFYIFFYIGDPTAFAWSLKGHFNAFILSGTQGAWPNVWHNAALTPRQQKQLDDKFDDGMPYTGMLTHPGTAGVSSGCASSVTPNVTATYVLTNTDDQCAVIWKAQF